MLQIRLSSKLKIFSTSRHWTLEHARVFMAPSLFTVLRLSRQEVSQI